MEEIEIQDFMKIALRVAIVESAEDIEDANKLIKLNLNLGELGKKTVFAGIKKSYQSKDLIGRKLVCVANLKPREMRCGTSEGMILACGEDESGIFLLSPDSGALAGMQVK